MKKEIKWKEVNVNRQYWKPEKENDEIIGVMLGFTESKEGYNKQPIIQTADGEQVTLPGHTALVSILDRKELFGEMIKVIYKGEVKGKNKRYYQSYLVFVAEK